MSAADDQHIATCKAPTKRPTRLQTENYPKSVRNVRLINLFIETNMWGSVIVALAAVLVGVECAGAGAARLVCYAGNSPATEGFSECTHLVYTGDARGDKLESLLKEYRRNNPRLKIILRVSEADKDLRTLAKSKNVQGLEIHDAHNTFNRTKVVERVEAAKSALASYGGGPLFLSLPAHPELLAKYYDLRVLVKKADLMMVETHALGAAKKLTYHPSRLSGLWDMMNTDSVVDLVVGLGVPASKIVISLTATGRQFTLLNETLSTPGSPTTENEPKEIGQTDLCRQLQKGRWTIERDQDLSAPYAFKNKTWISFEDASSVDVKGKYARVRGLAGLALHDADRDAETPCGPSLKQSLAKVLNQQSRAPRAAVLRSLEHEILSSPGHVRALDALQVSPYRITQVVDSDGVIHSIREDTRTEFSCSRQGYFVHPRSCARFYRCVKFDQLSSEYTVFEFDCPAGLAFDSRYEVCVWPGSLPHSQACPGSSEIAPVPQTRFICPDKEGYYADPENCRWFFACLDHGKAPLSAYEFRCPFGLGFDAARLVCDWPWLVPACGHIARYEAHAHGFSSAILTGAAGYQGQTADSVNVAAHNSLVSGASLDNLVGIQGGFLTKADALDSNFIVSQELANGNSDQNDNRLVYQRVSGSGGLGLVQPTKYNDQSHYTSGSLILDDYRLPTKGKIGSHGSTFNVDNNQGHGFNRGFNTNSGAAGISGAPGDLNIANHAVLQGVDINHGLSEGFDKSRLSQSAGSGNYNLDNLHGQQIAQTGQAFNKKNTQYQSGVNEDNSGAYIHDPSGDYAEPYRHIDSPVEPYIHNDAGYRHTGDAYDIGKYSGSYDTGSYSGYHDTGKYSGNYDTGKYNGGYDNGKYTGGSDAGQYSGKYDNGKYRDSYDSGKYIQRYDDGRYKGSTQGDSSGGQYENDNSGQYIHDGSGTYVDYDNYGYKNKLAGSIGGGYKSSYSDITGAGYINDLSGSYNTDNSGSYKADNSGKYEAGVYRTNGHIGSINGEGLSKVTTAINHGSYSQSNSGNYVNDAKVYTGASHTLTAGAINVGLVGKTTLVDVNYHDQNNNNVDQGHLFQFQDQKLHPGHVSFISQPAVSISHVGTDAHNLDGYSFVTTPTSSGVPTTATPVAVTTSLPIVTTYKTIYIPEAPRTKVKEIFGVTQPAVTYVQPTLVAINQYSTPSVQVTHHNQGVLNHEQSNGYSSENNEASLTSKVENSGYEYSKPSIKFEDGVSYTTSAPPISTFSPQSFSHQTVHKIETSGYKYSTPTPVTEEPFKKLVAYTTGPSIVTYQGPTTFGHQTIHKLETSRTPSIATGVKYDAGIVEQPAFIQYSTVQPTIEALNVPTYQPQVVSHQTLHKVDASRINSNANYEDTRSFVEHSTVTPIVTTYKPQTYIHQTLHNIAQKPLVYSTAIPKVAVNYQQPAVSVYQNPFLKYIEKPTPTPFTQPKYESFSHQTIHKSDDRKLYTPSIELGSNGHNDYNQVINYEEPGITYTTVKPAIQPVVSTYQPQVFSQQTLHKVDASRVNPYSDDSAVTGYSYEKPAVQFQEIKTEIDYNTPSPVRVTTSKPKIYSQKTIHEVETPNVYTVSTTAVPENKYTYKEATVSTYTNPFLKYTQSATPVTYIQPTPTIFTQNYQPEIQQHEVTHISEPIRYEAIAEKSKQQNKQIVHDYTYSQPEIQRDIETLNKYSDASVVSHQVFHQSNINDYDSGKNIVLVSTSPSTLVYEDHYVDNAPVKLETYKSSEYVTPKTEYPQSYSVSTVSPIIHQGSNIHKTNDEIDYKPFEYSQQYDTVQKFEPVRTSFSTYHQSQPKTRVTNNYKQASYESPEVQVVYKNEEYLPPVVSTAVPIITSTYRPRTYSTISTTRDYFQPAAIVNSYHSSTVTSYVSTTPSPDTYKASEYLPPSGNAEPNVVNFESFGYEKSNDGAKIHFNNYQDYSVPKDESSVITTISHSTPVHRKQNIVVETAKSNLLGFGTVGPDAGLVSSPVIYTTSAPPASTTYRPRIKSTTQKLYEYVQTTTPDYQAPEYLPPEQVININYENLDYKNIDVVSSDTIKYNPYKQESTIVSTSVPKRKQNIVVETAKSNLLGFGTVGPDAGLVSPVTYTTSAPNVVSSTETYSFSPRVTTYGSEQQGLFEVTASTPVRKSKPKVAIVTKINDFNPLLVRKLGAVCSCQSPVLVLKGKRPSVQSQDFDDYSDVENYGRGDTDGSEHVQKNIKIQTVSNVPIVSTTYNPIIVPDDSYYQDYQEQNNYEITPSKKEIYSESYIASSPATYSTTVQPVQYSSTTVRPRTRQRIKTVTAAPTYKTILLNQEVAPVPSDNSDTVVSEVDTGAFDRYGPGGWRSRDETLQGSVDCKRAGLFRHPKQCNKFYACRWDCTKQRFTLHVFNCPIQLSFDPSIGACNWPSQGPACQGDTLLTNAL